MGISVSPHPIRSDGAVVTTIKHPGVTLARVMSELSMIDAPAVTVDGEFIPRDEWESRRIWEDTVVQVRPTAQGGGDGSNPVAAVLTIAVLVLAGPAAGALFPALEAGSAALALAEAGIAIAGVLVINTLLPPRLPSQNQEAAGEAAKLFSLSGGSNRARPNQPLLMVIGKHRVYPDLINTQYTELVGVDSANRASRPRVRYQGAPYLRAEDLEGYDESADDYYYAAGDSTKYNNDQYLHQLFDFGLGVELNLTDLRLGETLLSEFSDVQQSDDPEQDIVAGNVDVIAGGELEYNMGLTRTTEVGTNKLAINIVCQRITFNSEGALQGQTTEFRISYTYDNEGTDVTVSHDVDLTSPSGVDGRTPVRRAFLYENLPAAAYDVTVTLLTQDDANDDRQQASANLISINAYQPDTANLSGRNPYAMRIRATGQLYGRVENFNAIAANHIADWDGTDWDTVRETSNPASWLRQFWLGIFRDDGQLVWGYGLPSASIDHAALQRWHSYCAANSLEINMVLDSPMQDAALARLIAQAGWGAVSHATGKWGVIWENDDEPVTAVFTPANIVAGSLGIAYENEGLADEIVGQFYDRDSGYEQNEIRRTVSGTTVPRRPLTAQLRGITDGDHAAKEVNRIAANQFYHIRTITFETNAAGPQIVSRGKVVGLGHNLAGGSQGGRLSSIDNARTGVTTTIQHSLVGSAGDTGTAWVWLYDGTIHSTGYTVTAAGLTLSQALPGAPVGIDENPLDLQVMLYASSVDPLKCRVTDIRHVRGDIFRIQVRDEIPEYYTARTTDLSRELIPEKRRLRPAVSFERQGVEVASVVIEDTELYEAVFIRTATERPEPETPTTTPTQDMTDGYIPPNWVDYPLGVTEELPFEWISVRTRDVATDPWGKYGSVALYSWARRTQVYSGRTDPPGLMGDEGDAWVKVVRIAGEDHVESVWKKVSGVWERVSGNPDVANWQRGNGPPLN